MSLRPRLSREKVSNVPELELDLKEYNKRYHGFHRPFSSTMKPSAATSLLNPISSVSRVYLFDLVPPSHPCWPFPSVVDTILSSFSHLAALSFLFSANLAQDLQRSSQCTLATSFCLVHQLAEISLFTPSYGKLPCPHLSASHARADSNHQRPHRRHSRSYTGILPTFSHSLN
jgi:hypothetical protein